MRGKIRQDISVIGPGRKGKKFQSDAKLKRYLQENPHIECDLSVTSTSKKKHREFLLGVDGDEEVDQAAKAEDLRKKKKPASKKVAANKKGKSDDIGEDNVETNNDGDEDTADPDNVVEKKSKTAAKKPAAKVPFIYYISIL